MASYIFTDESGAPKPLDQAAAEALLVARGAAKDPAEAKAKLAKGTDIDLPAKGGDPAGVVSVKK